MTLSLLVAGLGLLSLAGKGWECLRPPLVVFRLISLDLLSLTPTVNFRLPKTHIQQDLGTSV